MSWERGRWMALGYGDASHWHPNDVPQWPCMGWRRTTACGLSVYTREGRIRRPYLMRDLDMRQLDKWPEDPSVELPEYPWCPICFAAATGILVPAAARRAA